MKIRHFLYNAFLIEHKATKIAIDPGQNLWLFGFRSLLPKREWRDVTHVLVTHGDPDHYWQADRVANTARAPLVMHTAMAHKAEFSWQILSPRRRGLQFQPFVGEVHTLDVNASVEVDGVTIEGIQTKHGPLEFRVLGRTKRIVPSLNERAGFGAIGFKIRINGITLLNLGDSVLRPGWAGLKPDVLMLPIGGLGNHTWTMDVNEAIEAVRIIAPKHVVPCHHSVPFFLNRKVCPADDHAFARDVQKLGVGCSLLGYGDEVELETTRIRPMNFPVHHGMTS